MKKSILVIESLPISNYFIDQSISKQVTYANLAIQLNVLIQKVFYNYCLQKVSTSMRQNSYFSAFITGITLGIINPAEDGVIIKDPITGIGNVIAHVKDAIFHSNFDQGVWIGKRIIQNSFLGLSSYVTEILNQNILHYAFMVDGSAYHLVGQKGKSLGCGTIVSIQPLNEEKRHFQWFYKGKTNRSYYHIRYLIYLVNSNHIKYNVAFSNCIDVAKAFVSYARGIWNEYDAVAMIFPNSKMLLVLKGLGILRGVQLLQEGVNLLLP